MARQNWAARCEDLESRRAQLGAQGSPAERLALAPKLRPDGATKGWIARGLRRLLTNGLVRQGERVAPWGLSDIFADAVELPRECGFGQVGFLGADVADAFRQAPLPSGEYTFTAAIVDGARCYFGSWSSARRPRPRCGGGSRRGSGAARRSSFTIGTPV
eukprot:11460607-Alexandrium_andersonii.AAC.1